MPELAQVDAHPRVAVEPRQQRQIEVVVETSFGSQGRTVQRVILAVADTSLPASNQQQMYVGASRAKQRMTLYTDNKAAVRSAVKRSSLKLAASDLLPQHRKAREEDRRAQAAEKTVMPT